MITDVLTYEDAITNLVQFLGCQGDAKSMTRIRSTIPDALVEFAQRREWNYFDDIYRINTVESYDTGTVAYTHSTRELTLTGGTWPSWSRYGLVTIENETYKVYHKSSSTVLVLDASRNPGQDIASGTEYVIYQTGYVLPDNFRAMQPPQRQDLGIRSHYLPPKEFLLASRVNPSAGETWYYTIMGDPAVPGRMLLNVYGYPTSIAGREFIYQRYPPECRFTGTDSGQWGGTVPGASSSGTGTVTVSAGATSVTINSGALLDEYAGCILRLSRTGYKPEGLGSPYAYREQARIKSVESTTALTLWDAVTYAYSAKGYTVSSPIDLSPQMRSAFLALCQLRVLQRGGADQARLQLASDAYESLFDDAARADEPVMESRSAWDVYRCPSRSLSDYPMDPDWPNDVYP